MYWALVFLGVALAAAPFAVAAPVAEGVALLIVVVFGTLSLATLAMTALLRRP